MSAAEKLRALDKAARKAPWVLQDDWSDYGGVDSGPEGAGWIDPHGAYSDHRPDNELMVALRNALPQIVAAIEAAQGCTDWHRPEGNFTRLSAALDDLDRALS